MNQNAQALLSPGAIQAPIEAGSSAAGHERGSNPGTPRFGDNKKHQTAGVLGYVLVLKDNFEASDGVP